ncbi:MAG: hypothetical protein ABIH65_03125 [Nanoarchaeota archaeon]
MNIIKNSIISIVFLIVVISFLSANLEINSSDYSGYFTSGASIGNLSDTDYQGDSAFFYQQPIGSFNDTSYSGEYTFTSQYEEISEAVIIPPITGSVTTGGGGGGIKKFEIGPEEINIKLKQGETKRSTLTIKNTGTSELKMNIAESKLTEIIKISKSSFSLNPGETETIILDFLASEDVLPGLYIGKIIVNGDGIKKEVLVAVNIESKIKLFDIEIKIPSGYEQVAPGEDILLDVKVYNLGEVGKVDARIVYLIKDKEDNFITSSEDTFAIETQASFTKTINIPRNTPFGKYIISASINYDEHVAISSLFFEITEEEISYREKTYIVVIIILIIILSFMIYYFATKKKEVKKRKSKIQLRSLMRR